MLLLFCELHFLSYPSLELNKVKLNINVLVRYRCVYNLHCYIKLYRTLFCRLFED